MGADASTEVAGRRTWPGRLSPADLLGATRRFGERLFPPDADRRPVTMRGFAAAVVAVVVGTVVSLVRQPGLGAFDTVWYEDAKVFLADAASLPAWKTIVTAYQGYYHLVPRLLADIAVLFPPEQAAAVLAVEAAAVTSLLAVFVFVAARTHLPHPALRLLVSAPVVVMPLAQGEVPNVVCNLHFPLLYATIWALLWVPSSRTGRIVCAAVVAATVFSDLLALTYLPLMALRLWVRRDRSSAVLAGVLGTGLAVQVGGLLASASSRQMAPTRLDPAWALVSFGLRPVPDLVLGESAFPQELSSTRYLELAAVAWLVVLGVVFVAWRRWTQPRIVLAVAMTLQAVVLYCGTVMMGGVASPRYAATPALMVLVALAALVYPKPAANPRSVSPMWALVGLVAVVGAVNLRVDNPRAQGPSWHDGLSQARAVCAAAQAPATADVPVSPSQADHTAVLPCSYLLRP
jgi:hypothetical protein